MSSLYTFLAYCLPAAALLCGCQRSDTLYRSTLDMADSSITPQLGPGFYQVEAGKWRWTAQRFSVALKPPSPTPGHARVSVSLYLPEDEMDELGSLTLTAKTGCVALQPATFTSAGMHTYSAELPREALDTNVIPVQFAFDHGWTPTPDRPRELGGVVTSIRLESVQ